jgi:hypothetical protein
VQFAWFIALVCTICLEGLGRKYLPAIPSYAFYFAKDVVLLVGLAAFSRPNSVTKVNAQLYGGFKVAWLFGFAWTLVELLNPKQQSWLIGLIGMRAYWLWWFAPPAIAAVLQREEQKRRAIYVLLAMAVGVSVLAAVQFVSPADSAVNLYSVVDGEEISAEQYMVQTTGRARVASTFSFISGFSDFCMVIPTLLLSVGLDARDRKLRRWTLIATCVTAAVVPMSGSRASVLIGGAILVVTAWTAGLLVTRIGRRIVVGGIAAAIVAVAVFPDALIGVRDRFDPEETNSRFGIAAANAIPPVGLVMFDYPPLGIGTGMMQNVRMSMRIDTDKWQAEVETERYLIELGPLGFLIVWTAKFGLIIALYRAHRILKRAGRRGASAGAMAFLLLTFVGNFTFDHIWEALYFLGCGFILAEVVAVVRLQEAESRETSVEPPPMPAEAFARATLS